MAEPTLAELFAPGAVPSGPDPKSIQFAARLYLSLEEELAQAQAVVKEIQERHKTAEMALLDVMQAAGLSSIKQSSGETITSVVKSNYSLPPKDDKEKREAALAWLRRCGAKELVEEQIHAATLTAFMRQRAEKKLPLSPLIRAYTQRVIRVSRS